MYTEEVVEPMAKHAVEVNAPLRADQGVYLRDRGSPSKVWVKFYDPQKDDYVVIRASFKWRILSRLRNLFRRQMPKG